MTGLILLTLRELRARKVVVGLFAVATLVWLTLALALQLDVVDGSLAGLSLFGNQANLPTEQPVRDAEGDIVRDSSGTVVMEAREPDLGSSMLEEFVFGTQAFAAGAAYWMGILLALFATGGLVAALTERGTVDVILSKPLPRSAILAGRLAGVGIVAALLFTYLLGAVWLVMSIKTGIWNGYFLLAIGAVWLMFAVMYGLVTLVSVWSGSGPLALVVTLGLLFASLVLAIPDLRLQLMPAWRPVVDVPYHLLPKFASVGSKLVPWLATGGELGGFVTDGGPQPATDSTVPALYPLLSSVAFGLVCYAGAFALFRRTDY